MGHNSRVCNVGIEIIQGYFVCRERAVDESEYNYYSVKLHDCGYYSTQRHANEMSKNIGARVPDRRGTLRRESRSPDSVQTTLL